MIEDYKKYLKQHQQEVFEMITVGGFAVGLIVIGIGTLITMTSIDKFINNSKKLSAYRENLAIFQKCAEKIEDPSLIRSYCGDAPNEPIPIW